MGSYFEQARKLCADMTLREKLGQITQTVDGYHCYEKTADGIELNDTFRRVVSAYGGIGALVALHWLTFYGARGARTMRENRAGLSAQEHAPGDPGAH